MVILLNKKRRTILFWSCVFLFFIVFFFLSFSFFGVKVSFTEKKPKIEKTGAIYLEVEPDKRISFFLDKKLAHPKKRLFGGYFFEALLPGRYFLEIKKEGYFDWKKSIEVFPELVSFGRVKLVKENLFSKSKEIIPLDFLLTSSSTSSLELEKIKLKQEFFSLYKLLKVI